MTKSTVDWYQFQKKLTSNHESIGWGFKTLDHSFGTQPPSFQKQNKTIITSILEEAIGGGAGSGRKGAAWGHITIKEKIKLAEGWTWVTCKL